MQTAATLVPIPNVDSRHINSGSGCSSSGGSNEGGKHINISANGRQSHGASELNDVAATPRGRLGVVNSARV